jgi:hypothetical protein
MYRDYGALLAEPPITGVVSMPVLMALTIGVAQ